MLSFSEVLVILLVAVIVLGPKRLPEAARKIGHYVGLFRRIADSFKRELMTMDQTANRAINHATRDFDALLPKETADLADVLGISEEPPVVTATGASAQPTAPTSESTPEMPPAPLRPSTQSAPSAASPSGNPTPTPEPGGGQTP